METWGHGDIETRGYGDMEAVCLCPSDKQHQQTKRPIVLVQGVVHYLNWS